MVGGKYSVFIKMEDKLQIPYVQIWDNATNGKKFDCSIILAGYQYLPHGHSTDTMPPKHLAVFTDFMRQPCCNPH